ncbi:MAG: DUF928 domain-containing protein [Pleurocapsa sp.]
MLASAEAKVMSIKFQSSISQILTIVISIMAISINPLIAVAERPKPPKTGTPSGNTTPGTTRPEISCPVTPKPLTAIVANQGQDFTLEEYPTFLFYVPYSAPQISLMEFLLLNKTQTETIYRTPLKSSSKAGIIEIQLPPEASKALEVNTTYHWRFNLDCKPDRNIAPDLVLQGWIRRIPLNSEIANRLKSVNSSEYLDYQREEIWYEAIALLAQSHFSTPNNTQLTQAWNDVLESLKIEWLIGEPLVD